MRNSPSIRPILLIGACLLTLLMGVFIGLRLGDEKPEAGAHSDATASNARVRGEAIALELKEARVLDAELGGEEMTSVTLNPQVAALDAFLRLSQIDPLGAAQEALSASNDLERISKLALLLSEASSEEMPAIADLIASQPNDFDRMQQMSMMYYAWGRSDAPAAVAYAEERGGRHAGMAAGIALSSWASLDPASARAWVDASENPARYQRGLLVGWSESNPLQALQYLSGLEGESNLMDRWTAPQIARNLISERGVMALDDLAAMPATRNRRELLERLADELGESNPAAAAVRLSAIKDPEVLRAAVPELAQEWAQQDPQAALEFVSGYKENTELYARAMAEVIEEWAERDPYEAGEYLNEQPASPELDRSVAEYSREVARVDPDAAMSFAVSVNDTKLRADTIRRVARDWKRAAPEAYAAWAADNPEIAPSEEGQRKN
ncbi:MULTISPECIES: hypothetical protein [unclassified Lentimonas]|uniref:hypothetical protein n=1 Tax=unclassified Lentimonas TaxID=2630993 RepID=UPI001322B096|nr:MULTISPECIES: hypothetical protein [unclassified Lentimonas]CAA6679864.1 Unannotated [Lentimonas sp. CC4]CAA6685622.1 Unannotated [Lentimonas sp. CC6]CAA7077067.1 Unannotated [Lentimonas sp. CC4]CAA7168852.1 Unannotated [Lentimonas sp. CC21]CAA7180785.1 Unannotated [Lentimonas sp. CC8]